MYNDFAQIYDRLMDDFDYPRWAAHYSAILEGARPKLKTIAECGCGTGSLSVELAARGYKLTASDLSEDMLRAAAEKARGRGVFIPFIRQDMRALALPRPVDAVLACCDGVNYLTEPEDVKKFFRSAADALKPGGVLAFDISSRFKLEEKMGNAFFGEERDEVVYLWQNTVDPATHIATMDITFFVQEEGELYRRFGETHTQRAHSAQEIMDWLKETGFESIACYGGFTTEAPRADDDRLHFAAIWPDGR